MRDKAATNSPADSHQADQMRTSNVPRPAATVILARDSTEGMEVFLLQRTHAAHFAASAYVFPGGAVDVSDCSTLCAELCFGLDDPAASRLLSTESGGLAYWATAIRECFEESGLLFACDNSGTFVDLSDSNVARQIADDRRQLAAGELTLAEVCQKHDFRLAADRLVYFSHWIAPPIAARRYDTRFFIAAVPPLQNASPDHRETIDQVWISPATALARHQRGELNLVFATVQILESLKGFRDTAALLAHARALPSIATIRTRPALDDGNMRFLMPDDPAYAEVGKLDPEGTGRSDSQILPGAMTRLSSHVRRIASPNPHFMRGSGTNTYLLGAAKDIAVIDPGPAIEGHVRSLLELAEGRIRWILVTHTHSDHSPAAMLLKAQTGAEVLGIPAPQAEHQDQYFAPDRILHDGERLRIAGCVIRVIHTPGHASNHVCYLLEAEQMLFTGDHIMQGSTVVINPPDGNMIDYLASLRKIQQEDIAWLAPGHGFLMDTPRERIDRLLAHRQAREQKLVAALHQLGATTIDQLLPVVYAEVPTERFPVAARSLLAHLIKLRDEQRVMESGSLWSIYQ